jgi:hypothetical protein
MLRRGELAPPAGLDPLLGVMDGPTSVPSALLSAAYAASRTLMTC